jgi:hypothetical protein
MTFRHGGSNHGYRAFMRFCPDAGSGYVLMLNSDIGAVMLGEFARAYETVSGWAVSEETG